MGLILRYIYVSVRFIKAKKASSCYVRLKSIEVYNINR